VCHDVNYDSFLLALAVVEGESADSWRSFLDHLLVAVPEVNSPETTVISYRDKGLTGVDNEIPLAKRAWCCWHLAKNVRQNHGDAAKKVFWRIVRARDEATWDACLRDLAETWDGQAAVGYLMGTYKTKWASRFFLGRRYGHLTSNVAEQLNNLLRSTGYGTAARFNAVLVYDRGENGAHILLTASPSIPLMLSDSQAMLCWNPAGLSPNFQASLRLRPELFSLMTLCAL
jgi:hypothetical protein